MVDLSKIGGKDAKPAPTDPTKIFERQPKPEGVNDLWKSQDEVLRAWQSRRKERDILIKLNTGGGKTLVGLLIAQAVMNERGIGSLYLCANNQLVDQTLAKAREFQLPAVRYEAGPGRPLPAAFHNGQATLIGTYRSLFHGFSKFNVKGRGTPVRVGALICDDAHTAFTDVRDAFSIVVTRKRSETLYKAITNQLRPAAEAVNRLGTYDHRVGGQDLGVFEVPYWGWKDVAGGIRDLLSKHSRGSEYEFQLPLVMDSFDAAHVFVRAADVMITPFIPPVQLLPTFAEAPHRVFMSATIADDSALIRTFDTDERAVRTPIAPASLAGVGERMILAPALTPVGAKQELAVTRKLCERVAKRGVGVVILVPSEILAVKRWDKVAKLAVGDQVALAVDALNNPSRSDNGPYVFPNRYDGVDLAKDACRLLVLDGLPQGASAYDEYRANALRGSSQIELSLAQRVEQGLGRGTRGAGDYCVVVLLGTVQDWVSRRANSALMTPASRAQLELGLEMSKEVVDVDDFEAAVNLCLERKPEWVKLHARELAERSEAEPSERAAADQAVADSVIERQYFARYSVGNYHAAKEVAEEAAGKHSENRLFRGWMLQLAARAAFYEENGKWTTAHDLQIEANAANNALFPPPGHQAPPLLNPLRSQAKRVAEVVEGYEQSSAYLAGLDRATLALTGSVPANVFEESIRALGEYLGFSSERLDVGGREGPDNIWRTDDAQVFVVSCKNEKAASAPLHKKDLAQLFIDAKWVEANQPSLRQILVVAHPTATCDEHLPTQGVYALTIDGLSALLGATKVMAGELSRPQMTLSEREQLARTLLKKYELTSEAIVSAYLREFSPISKPPRRP